MRHVQERVDSVGAAPMDESARRTKKAAIERWVVQLLYLIPQ
jgi:hypothetical protein